MKHLSALNEQQKQAVLHKEGPLLILAGAGAGKTRVIVHRIAELIRSGVSPERILAVTFTNKAAREMKERVTTLLKSDISLSPFDIPRAEPFVGTFHGLSLAIIKAFHQKVGLPARFTIMDRGDSTRVLREAIKNAGFDPKQLEPSRVISVMSRHKGNAVGLEEFRTSYASSYIDEAIADVWEKYAAALKKEKALDFDDILLTAHTLLESHTEVRDFFQHAWSYVHVDEYQDVNRVQYELVKMLAETHGNIAAVGDADQNIYSWRGASIEHILNFERDFPRAETVLLTENYRSTKNIIAAANDAIAKNVRRKEKELFTQNREGEKITIAGFPDETTEAAFVALEAKKIVRGGTSPNEIAVLYRANFQSRALEEAFLALDVPYQVLGTRFFERKEIKDALSYLKAALSEDSVSDFMRAIATPSRGIGKVTLAKVVAGQETLLPDTQRRKISDFRTLLSRIKQKAENEKASETVRAAIVESGLWRLYEKGTAEDTERMENLKELVTVASKYDAFSPIEGIEKLLEESALQSDQDELDTTAREKKNGVKLMTVHAAKGLEFGTVFITGLEEGLFPHEKDDRDRTDDEEERRLFYVALTRAKEKAYLTYAVSRRIFGTMSYNTPSEFITELDPALVENITGHSSDDMDSINYN